MFCTLRNFSPPCAVNAARASSIGVLSAVMFTAGAVAVAAGGSALLAGGWSWANNAGAKPPTQTTIASEFKKSFFIYRPFRSEVQSHLRINATVTSASATRRTETTERAAQRE